MGIEFVVATKDLLSNDWIANFNLFNLWRVVSIFFNRRIEEGCNLKFYIHFGIIFVYCIYYYSF